MSLTDNYIIKNVANLAEKFRPENLHFVHVSHKPDIPDEVLRDIPDLQIPELTYYKTKIQHYIDENFNSHSDVKIHVVEGNPFTELLRLMNKLPCDLVIVGNKGKENQGIITRKIARKAPCSVLFVPELFKESINSIVTPTDFSDYSNVALTTSRTIAKAYKDSVVHLLHVYKDSSKYLSQVFETVHEIDQILVKRSAIDQKLTTYAQHRLNQYLEKIKGEESGIVPHITSIERGKEIGDAIDEWIKVNTPDMVVIGAKGQSAAGAVLLGSVSEQVYTKGSDHLLMVVKRKGENNGLLRALLRN
ncbi:MAG: universal stress protein [Leptolyngbya sp. SIO1D8]|nr:universal stress protein [Leptolyngbya sp. SIO1D8]